MALADHTSTEYAAPHGPRGGSRRPAVTLATRVSRAGVLLAALGLASSVFVVAASRVPAELMFGEHDARVATPPSHALTHTLLAGVGHTPPWAAAEPDR